MSGSVTLEITTGTDWVSEVYWRDGSGDPVVFTNPAMEIRQDLSPTSPLLARLDVTGNLEGKLTLTAPGTLRIQIPASKTKLMKPGTAFWDLYVTVANQRARLLFGSIAIKPHVTSSI